MRLIPRSVYFMQRDDDPRSPVKIGAAVSPVTIMDTFDHWSPYKLRLLCFFHGDTNDERNLHYMFRRHHMRREWFKWSPDIADMVAVIRDSDFSPDSLPRCPKGFRLWDGCGDEQENRT